MRELFSNSRALSERVRYFKPVSRTKLLLDRQLDAKVLFVFPPGSLTFHSARTLSRQMGHYFTARQVPEIPLNWVVARISNRNYFSTVDRRAERWRDLKTDYLIVGLRQFFSKREDSHRSRCSLFSATKRIYSGGVACIEIHFAPENASVSDKWKEVQTGKHYRVLRSV